MIVEVSGGVRSYTVDGRQLLDGYEEREMCSGGRGQLLMPWPNRLRDGRYEFDGESHQLPLSEPERMNAIHGLLRWESWRVADRSPEHVVVEHALHPRPGYPFALHVSADYRLGPSGLSCTVTATNVGDQICPYGAGAHPYLMVGGPGVNDCWLEGSAETRLLADERGIPVGAAAVAGSEHDFRSPRRIGSTRLDTAFTDLGRDADGRAWVRLWRDDRSGGVSLWMDNGHPYYMLFTGDSLPEAARRRRSVAIEPMTCAPNAFASGDGLVTLSPGESMVTAWGISPSGSAQ